MSRVIACTIFASVLAVITPAEGQRDPWAGTWRGALTTGGDTTDVTLTIVAEDGAYTGAVTGFAASTEVRLSAVTVDDAELTVQGATGPILARWHSPMTSPVRIECSWVTDASCLALTGSTCRSS